MATMTRLSGRSRGKGGIGAMSLTPIPTKTTTTTDMTRTGTQVIDELINEVTRSAERGVTRTDMQHTTDEALAALQGILGGTDIDPLVKKKDTAAIANIEGLQQILSALDPDVVEARAGGRTADLARQLREQVLPGIFGGSELAGTSGGNALAMLLAQDAAIRTGEAQSRVVEDAIINAVSQSIAGAGTLAEAVQGTSAASERVQAALEAARGAVTRGSEITAKEGVAQTTGTREGTTTTTETTKGGTTQEVLDPLAWAQLQAQLDELAGSQPTQGEKLLAAFMAAGGSPGSLEYQGMSRYGQGVSRANQRLLSSLRQNFGL